MIGEVVTRGDLTVVVRPMRDVTRLLEVLTADPRETFRFWCYPSATAAVLAARVWPLDQDEPVGWLRRGGRPRDARPLA